MAATPNSSTVSLKLLMDVKRQKVLFAKAGKDFMDFLFALLSLPIGTVIRLLSKGGMVGSFGKLYESIENLDNTYIHPTLNKDILLKPKAPVDGPKSPNILKLANNVESSARKELYLCSHSNNYSKSHPYVTENPNEKCPSCSYPMNLRTTYVGQPTTTEATSGASAAGYVKGVVTYVIMDDLEVKPMSTISSITMLNRFNIKDVGALEEKVVELGMDKGVKLLKESLQSKSVLTNVFLEKKAGIGISFSEDQLRRGASSASAATNTTSISFGASSTSAATSNSVAIEFGMPSASASTSNNLPTLFGASTVYVPSTDNASVFGLSNGASSTGMFPFTSSATTTAPSTTNTTSISFGASSTSATTSNSAATVFGILPSASAPAPFQASNSLGLTSSSFSLGVPDKSNRRIVIVRVNRKK